MAGEVPPHPYGVKPWGQAFFDAGRDGDARGPGLGRLAVLPDELVLAVLYELPAADLQRLALASRALYVFAHYDDLWKALALEGLEGGLQSWQGTWRETYLAHAAPRYVVGSHRPIAVRGFYSDLLHQPWVCANIEMRPEWLEVDNVDRVSALSVAEFQARYEGPNRPVVITDAMASWPALHKWTRSYLLQAFAGRQVIVGNAPMRLGPYLAYSDNNRDEMKLYLFDKAFALAAPQLAADYSVPPYFADDLFAALGEDERPDYRWLIIGPKGSGSSFHVDPNATSAWNAVVTGSKKWILYPPGCIPPGVHVSDDGADVAAPVSLAEWFLNFYDAARRGERDSGSDSDSDDGSGAGAGARPVGGPSAAANGGGADAAGRSRRGGVPVGRSAGGGRRRVRPLECVVRAGELLFVPRGWFHMVVNLEDSVAVTQNFVSPLGLGPVLAFLASGSTIPGLVSGCEHRESLHLRFLAALHKHRPEVLAALEEHEAARRQLAERENRLSRLFKEAGGAAAPGGGKQKDQDPQQQQQQQQQEEEQQAKQPNGLASSGKATTTAATDTPDAGTAEPNGKPQAGFAFSFF